MTFTAVLRLIKYVLGTRERRYERDARRRAEWIDHARNAPSLQSQLDSLDR
jgi:hypothetical protein